ncbi:histidine phosphatase family protein [Mycolicibacterium komossense]|uniref:Histidine phosphatase family protein n=1 Tax=Mycolicibacterium komossense TaxID=1779 RepID=A0ABT3CJP2_9MYCO|nr:histidine phosphatase family protein [Mycolicibacterium komossense]MCV7229657.1 histidine phosphatase family protein [Mycolicibacterium komossense]
MQESITRRVLGVATAVIAALALLVGIALPADAMTITWVRHGESEGNASGYIDTKTPGPPLTTAGWEQANTVAGTLDPADYDAVFASTMIRTQQTATPFAADKYHGGNQNAVTISTDPYHPVFSDNVVVLNGLQEINAGFFEGSSQTSGIGRIGYILAPIMWTLGLRFARIPGGEDGNEFEARVNGALAQIQDSGSETPLVFDHGATIMFWTLMNVDNPDITLALTHPLNNTDVVVVDSNGQGGWTLKSWAGTAVGPATLPTQLFVNFRDLIVAPQTALYNLRLPILNLDGPGIVAGVQQGVSDVVAATGTFVVKSVQDIAAALGGLGQANTAPPAATKSVQLGSPTTTSAQTAVEPKVSGTKSTGATDLSDGNKSTPISTLKAAASTGDKASAADDGNTGSATKPAPSGKKGTGARSAKAAA